MQIKITYKTNRDGLLFDQSVILPVNPEGISISESVKSQVINVLGGEDRSLLGSHDLKTVEIASFFPNSADAYTIESGKLKPPSEYINILTAIVKDKRSVELDIFDDTSSSTKSNMDFYMKCYLTKFNYSEKGGSLDVTYSLSFQERKDITLDWRPVDQSEVSLSSRTSDVPVPKTYTVSSGDTLWRIAQKVLGDGDRWREIYNNNKSVIGPNPNLIHSGQRLVLADVK